MYTIPYSYIISNKRNPLIAICFRERIPHKNINDKRKNTKEI